MSGQKTKHQKLNIYNIIFLLSKHSQRLGIGLYLRLYLVRVTREAGNVNSYGTHGSIRCIKALY